MKDILKAMLNATIWTVAFVAIIYPAPQVNSVAEVPKSATNAMRLTVEDQKQLDLIAAQLAQLSPQVEAARKQQREAQVSLASANAFLAEYEKTEAIKQAFLYRIAADVCRCESKELQFAADGKSLLRKEVKAKP